MHPPLSLTRRRAIITALGAVAASSLSPAQTSARPKQESPGTSPNQASTSIHYDLEFTASTERFFEAILDQKQFAAFSGMPATIDRSPGGAFSMFGGQITGRTIESVSNQRIVQAWRPGHWGPGVYSLVHFELKALGQGCSLLFDHTGFPAGDYDSLDSGWHLHYWEPLKKYFAAKG